MHANIATVIGKAELLLVLISEVLTRHSSVSEGSRAEQAVRNAPVGIPLVPPLHL